LITNNNPDLQELARGNEVGESVEFGVGRELFQEVEDFFL
jgi:hypothetical protein